MNLDLILPLMRYQPMEEPRPGPWGDVQLRAHRIGDPDKVYLLRFHQGDLSDDHKRNLKLDQSTLPFLAPQQFLTLPDRIFALVRDYYEELATAVDADFLRASLDFLESQNRHHGHLCLSNLTANNLWLDTGWAQACGHGQSDPHS